MFCGGGASTMALIFDGAMWSLVAHPRLSTDGLKNSHLSLRTLSPYFSNLWSVASKLQRCSSLLAPVSTECRRGNTVFWVSHWGSDLLHAGTKLGLTLFQKAACNTWKDWLRSILLNFCPPLRPANKMLIRVSEYCSVTRTGLRVTFKSPQTWIPPFFLAPEQ